MALFLSTTENKVDPKGRVSVPAPFREALRDLNSPSVVVFASYRLPCLEGWSLKGMEELSESVESLDLFSEQKDILTASLFADARALPIDSDGRIILPTDLAAFAGIDIPGKAAFVGQGKTFQIWEPGRFMDHRHQALQKAREQKLTLKPQPKAATEK